MHNQKFTLTVKWEKGAFNPIWTLYEESDSDSRTVWSQPFAPSDMDFMYDVLSMSAGAGASPDSKIPENLKPLPEEETDESDKKSGKTADKGSAKVEKPEVEAKPAQKEAPPQNAPFPQQQQMPPQMGYPMPPGYVYGPIPMPPPGYGGPAYMPPGTPYPQAPTNWNFGSPPATASGITARIDPAAVGASPPSMEYLEKRPGILIGSLLIEAELITEPTLEAALKIQELVKQGRLSTTRAPEILKMFFSMGPSIEDYIDPSDLKAVEAPKPAPAPSLQPRSTGPQAPNKDLSLALSLLIKAGVLKEADVNMANQVRAKHGGDIRNILQAAGKFDHKTIDAALICVDLERRGALKVEQCIIALNYCSRSRVGFDEAIDELGWENPRKQKKI